MAGMTARQMVIAAILGVVLWYAAAVLIAWISPMGALEGSARLLTYALVWPGTFPFVLLAWRLTGVVRAQLGLTLAVTTTAAMVCDGIALAWFPGLYGGEGQVAAAGAVILWGAAGGQIQGMIMAATGSATESQAARGAAAPAR